MIQQTRWFCHSCRREWVYAHQWDETAGVCPNCQGQRIERVTYTPVFPGADIGTKAEDVPRAAPELPSTPVIDPERVHIAENQTLALVVDNPWHPYRIVSAEVEAELKKATAESICIAKVQDDEELALSSPEFE
jgi:hypothetical protein